MSEILWTDCEKRLYEGGVTNFTLINRGLKDLVAAHYGHLLAYDEGLAKGDAILAGALWRNLFEGSPTVPIAPISLTVAYVRRELVRIDETDDGDLLRAAFAFGKARSYEI
ncbi:Protein cbp3, mitochondrial [Gonapodya sp. JEL0774]|nr:Protein cbp3, mitochondrial [Gonapodya sp. JEL0774]